MSVHGVLVLFLGLGLASATVSPEALAHHYKGLPHYSYFKNYPQVPTLEFIKETPEYEVFVTVYNFQGLNLDVVDSPDDVRFYLYIYDVKADKVYSGAASFELSSGGSVVHATGVIEPEQENIFVIQRKLEQQNDLNLRVKMNVEGVSKVIDIPVRITETFAAKYGVYLAIVAFFLVVAGLKLTIARDEVPARSGRKEQLSGI